MSNEKVLTETLEVLFTDEKSAYDYVEKSRSESSVEQAKIVYKKATKKSDEYWVATVKIRIADPMSYVSFGGDDE